MTPTDPPAARPADPSTARSADPSAARSAARSATLTRKTGETDISLSLTLEGAGKGRRETGVGFFDHMLDLLARHGRLDLDVKVSGDLETGAHHTAE
ncbi:MAG TPA: hypothetical protein VL972_06245, partial [Solirubrobacteraceae bacterium]|nr:hypothetical protein [Solirubrobacteraceae bacterium]